MLNMLQPLLLLVIAVLILSGVLAGRLAKRITEPLNRLDWRTLWRTIPMRSWRPCCGGWSTSAARSTGRWTN